jgi:hypothetical protein
MPENSKKNKKDSKRMQQAKIQHHMDYVDTDRVIRQIHLTRMLISLVAATCLNVLYSLSGGSHLLAVTTWLIGAVVLYDFYFAARSFFGGVGSRGGER